MNKSSHNKLLRRTTNKGDGIFWIKWSNNFVQNKKSKIEANKLFKRESMKEKRKIFLNRLKILIVFLGAHAHRKIL